MGVLDGKVAIVTGGARGIGRGMGTALAKAGAAVTLTDIRQETLDGTVKELTGQGLKVQGVVADGRFEDQVKNAVKKTVDKFGPVYMLINCAQTAPPDTPLHEITREGMELSFNSGFYASWYYMVACFPYLTETKGTVVNFASDAGLWCNAGQLPYNATKEAIRALSRTAAREWGPLGINVNTIVPGMLSDGAKQYFSEHPGHAEMRLKQIPLGRFGDPENDAGGLAVFLCSPGSKYMTGETFNINGGVNLRP
jgi:NAD(P)-dependent dehydrogenase (short-subunit alcohol dehydrogenase family)